MSLPRALAVVLVGSCACGLSIARAADPVDACIRDVQAGRMEQALRCYEELVRKDPGNAAARGGKAAILANQGRIVEALREFDLVLKTNPRDAVALNGRAMTLLALERYEEAFTALEAAIRNDPENVQALDNFAQMAFAFGEWRIAETIWTRVLTVDLRDLDARRGLGEIRLVEGRVAEAIENLRIAVEAGPNDARAHWLLGKALGQTRHAQAVPALERAAYLAPDESGVWLDLGRARFAVQDVHLAGQALARALDLAPDDPEVSVELGKVYLVMGSYDAAEMQLAHALELDPSDDTRASLFFHLGILRERRGRQEDAEKAYRIALQIEPDASLAAVNLGVLLHQRGQVDEAMELFERALAVEPGLAIARLNRGAALLQSGRSKEATEELRKVVASTSPGDPERVAAEGFLKGGRPGVLKPDGQSKGRHR